MKNPLVSTSLLLSFLAISEAMCPNMCNGHGRCVGVNRCECYSGWGGGDCSQRKCPVGNAWVDVPSGEDVAHQPVECSNRGYCNHKTGECTCMEGFEGLACNRMTCPIDCSQSGHCNSMRRHAETIDLGRVGVSDLYTNIRAAYDYSSNWDADMIYGCTCDSGFDGWDCKERVCPRGDDPLTTNQEDEVQLIRCDMDPTAADASDARFTFSFGGAVSHPFSSRATPADIRTILESMPTIGEVSVVYTNNGVTFCDNTFTTPLTQEIGSNVIKVTFLTEHGSVPRLLILDEHGRPLSGVEDNRIFVAAKGESLRRSTSAVPEFEDIQSIVGTKEDAPCSNRGVCDKRSGICKCFAGFSSSNGRGGKGSIGDCGNAYSPVTSCPGAKAECSSHGICSGHPEYKCTCESGWGGGDCSIRLCPTGPAWFDLPSGTNTAHGEAECSNRGFCDRASGACVCETAFAGAACERSVCPGPVRTVSGSVKQCSGHGQCMSMARLAEFAVDTLGDPIDASYGLNKHNPATWDAEMLYGCHCDPGYTGYDCSERLCPFGNDLTLYEADHTSLDELQTLSCSTLGGATPTFRLSFRGEETGPIAHDADADTVRSELEKLSTILGRIDVTFSGSTEACAASPAVTDILFAFRTAHGDVPPIRVVLDKTSRDRDDKTYGTGLGFSDSELLFIGGDAADNYASSFTYSSAPYPATGIGALEQRKGTSGWQECSGRGICDRSTGLCQCFLGFGASDNMRKKGDIQNCGWREERVSLRGNA